MNKLDEKKEAKKILVRGTELFYKRRLNTIPGLTKAQFRGLRNNEAILIDSKIYDKELYIKVKESE